jgi:hypothetical protein
VSLRIPGEPSGTRPRTGSSFRERVAAAAGALERGHGPGVDGLDLAFALRPGHWVDLDTLTETALAGLRDGGVLPRGLAGLDGILATKAFGEDPGLEVWVRAAATLRSQPRPGPLLLEVTGPAMTSAPDRAAKRAWRALVADAWGARPTPPGDVWVEVVRAGAGSLTRGLEGLLDALEPVLGRDPRGRPWQEFFPNDDRIVWLRVARADVPGVDLPSAVLPGVDLPGAVLPGATGVRLRLGPVG